MKIIETNQAPKAIGPYVQATVHNGWMFSSGQLAINPSTGQIEAGDITSQTHQVLKNIGAVLKQAGGSYSHVMKTTVYLTDMADFKAMNDVYALYFGDHKPARTTIAVLALPLGGKIEVDVVASGLPS